MNVRFFAIALLVSLSSCSFNKMFLKPTTLSKGTLVAETKIGGQPMTIDFTPPSLQPTFLKEKDTVTFNFTITSVVFKSQSGNELNGWWLQPKDMKASITLLHLHGNGGFVGSQFQAVAPLVKFGFQIFIVDYSGFGFSEGKATRKNVLLDSFAALDYLKGSPENAGTSLVIYGQSLGGHVAAVVAAEKQTEIDGLVLEGAFSSHKDVAADRASFFGRWLVSEQYSAKKAIQDYRKPVLVIHSTEDKTIPFKMGEKLYSLANDPKDFYQIDKCHICGPAFYGEQIAERIQKMLGN